MLFRTISHSAEASPVNSLDTVDPPSQQTRSSSTVAAVSRRYSTTLFSRCCRPSIRLALSCCCTLMRVSTCESCSVRAAFSCCSLPTCRRSTSNRTKISQEATLPCVLAQEATLVYVVLVCCWFTCCHTVRFVRISRRLAARSSAFLTCHNNLR